MVFARMHPGQTPAGIMRGLREGGVAARSLSTLAIVPLADVFGSPNSRTTVIREGSALGVVSGLALLVLAGGCATLTALVLVHYERRRRELAVRIALGASRARLTTGLICELGVLACAGTIGAILIAAFGLSAFPSLSLPGGVELGRLDLSVDWRVLGAAVTTTLITLVAATLLPLRRFTRARVASELLAGPASTASASSHRVRQTLLAAHVSATIVVLVAAGLFVRAVIHGFGGATGFDTNRTLFATIPMPATSLPTGGTGAMGFVESSARQAASLADALRAVPGVDAVAIGYEPIGPNQARRLDTPATVQTGTAQHTLRVAIFTGSPELLQSLGVPILAGRALTVDDATATANPPAGIITASLAQRLWPDASPLGQVVSLGGRQGHAEIVGVARDFVFGSLTNPAVGVIITAGASRFGNEPRFVIHADNVDAVMAPIRKAVADALPGSTWVKLTTGRDLVARDLGRQRLGAWFFSGFGLTALVLGVGGVFGLVAYLAESRRREFGVRLAMGAGPGDLVRHGLAAALGPVAIGVAAGLLVAAIVAQVFTSLLNGLSALDPITYAAVAATMLICAAVAGLGAAWRLRRLVPIDALRID
jgi:predicted permease